MRLKALFVMLFISLSGLQAAFAQNAKFDSVRTSAVGIGYDLSRLYQTIITPSDRRFEIMADWNLNKNFFVAEYGRATDTRHSAYYNYFSNGSYLRLGYERNYMINTDDVFFVGARYAFSNYKYHAYDARLNNDPDGLAFFGNDGKVPDAEHSIHAEWLELVSGLKVKMYGPVYLGFTVRGKLKIDESDNGEMRSLYIPGFGKAAGSAGVGFNYYIMIRIPYSRKIVKPEPLKSEAPVRRTSAPAGGN
ncbi:MAG: DUF6048 family protein [Bacteroidota bacterium]